MKVIVFGGAGDMGSEAARDLAASSGVEHLTLADYDKKAARTVASEIGEAKVEGVFCDVNDLDSVVALMKEADISLSCVGPFYKFEKKMISAAIEARKPYVSICDDYDAAEEALSLDKQAKKAGITVLTGMGWTPGLSNVLARLGIDSLDTPLEVHIAWAGSADDSEGIAFIKHTLHIFTGETPTYKAGRWRKVPAGSGKEKIEFPEPIGKVNVFHLGHPEPVTIPHFIPGLNAVTLKGAVIPDSVNVAARMLNRLGLTNTPAKRDAGAAIFHAIGSTLYKTGEFPLSGINVRVIGEKDGKMMMFTAIGADRMKRLTAIPASIGTILVGRKQVEHIGVAAPEIAVPPYLFLAELKKRNIFIDTKMEYL